MRERLEILRRQRVELEEAIADLERTCGIVDGMLRERQGAAASPASAEKNVEAAKAGDGSAAGSQS
jgi:hypothetical protein